MTIGVNTSYGQQSNDSLQLKNISLEEIEISGRRTPTINSEMGRVVSIITRDEISKLPVTSTADILEYVGNIDVRTRGVNGVQSDLSFRGGTFDQVMILLNGINITDPQTGHHNLNLPIDVQSIERIEILQGAGARAFGPNAFSGAINIITGSKENDEVQAMASYGMYKYQNENANLTLHTGKLTHFASGSFVNTDGYIDNTDFKGNNIFYQGKLQLKNDLLEFQAGYNEKRFGANSFYSAAYPNQYEHLRTYFGSIKLSGGDRFKYNTSAYQRINQDHFELFRDMPQARNYHLTEVMGINFNTYTSWVAGKTSIGADIRNEAIWSNTLGHPMNDTLPIPGEEGGMFTKKYSRSNTSIFLEHSYSVKKISFSVGVLANWNSGLDWKYRYYPGLDINYQITNNLSAFTNINKALRMPTFTDMFNTAGKRIGDEKLKPEESVNYEIGLKHFSMIGNGSLLFFIRDGKNLIDWGSFPSDNGYNYARNIADISTTGLEFNYTLNLQSILQNRYFVKTLDITYTNINQTDNPIENYSSLYVMDYLNYKFSVRLTHKIYSALEASWSYLYEDRSGSYQINKTQPPILYKPYGLLNGRIAWLKEKYNIYCEATNIFNTNYVDIAGVKQPGIWLKGGIIIKLNL